MTYNVGGQEWGHQMASHSSPGSIGQSQPNFDKLISLMSWGFEKSFRPTDVA